MTNENSSRPKQKTLHYYVGKADNSVYVDSST